MRNTSPSVEVHRLKVPPGSAGERLDRHLSQALPGLSRSRIQKLIRDGGVLVSGDPGKASLRLRGGEEVVVAVPAVRPLELVPWDSPLRVLFEDAHLMVVDKPAGMVVHPAPGHPGSTLVNILLARADGLSGIGGVARPGIVHRLDKDPSGILVVAKTDEAHAGLSAQLAAHRMERLYRGIVWGSPAADRGTVATRVGRHPVHRKKMAVLREGGRLAVTHYRRLASFGPFSLLEFRLETGRTHQVRLHCAHLGCPIVGDDVYGRSRKISLSKGRDAATLTLSRFMLHACRLGFVHPATGARLEFAAPDPPEFDLLRRAAGGG